MKFTLVAFSVIVVLIAMLMFGSIGLAELVHWPGWPDDVLVFAAMGFVFLAGISMMAWKVFDKL